MNFITSGTIAGILSIAAAWEARQGNPIMAAWLGDPATAQTMWAVGSGLLALAAGAARGIQAAPKADK